MQALALIKFVTSHPTKPCNTLMSHALDLVDPQCRVRLATARDDARAFE